VHSRAGELHPPIAPLNLADQPVRAKEVVMAAKFPFVFAIFQRVTQLDFTGPFEAFVCLPDAQCVRR
jgi:hypothetical protein